MKNNNPLEKDTSNTTPTPATTALPAGMTDTELLDFLDHLGCRVSGWEVSWENEKPWVGLRLRQTPHAMQRTAREAIRAFKIGASK